MLLPLDTKLRIGVTTTVHETSDGATRWQPTIAETRALVELVDACGFDSLWCGDHLSFPLPILDPLLVMAQMSAWSTRLTFGTAVYLLPLRHPVPVAKQVATLDHLTEGRFIFGVGIGGEFPKEFQAAGVPHNERGRRLGAAIPLLRQLWSGQPISYDGPFWPAFDEVPLQPAARQSGGPPIWCGGRSDVALARAGCMADGYIAYVVTPDMYRESLTKIAAAADAAGRKLKAYGTAHVLFTWIDESYDKALDVATANLSRRYAMDFRRAAQRYCALGTPEQVAARIREFHVAGVRHIAVSPVGPDDQLRHQFEWCAKDVLPLLQDLRSP